MRCFRNAVKKGVPPSQHLKIIILGEFTKLRKATISFVMSVRASVYQYGIPVPLDGF